MRPVGRRTLVRATPLRNCMDESRNAAAPEPLISQTGGRMDDARKYAYRTLLFLAMNDIRSIGVLAAPPDKIVNPEPAHDAAWWMERVSTIANWLENLAGFSA